MKFLTSVALACCIVVPVAGAQTVGCVKPGIYALKSNGNMRAAFNSMQVDSVFKGVSLSADQRVKAEAIVDEAKARSPGIAKADDPKHTEIMGARNDKLVALSASEADKGKIRQNIAAMAKSPSRCDVSGG